MKMAQLTEFGVSQWFVDRWIQTVGDELLNWQADAIRHFDLFGRQPADGKRNLLVIAPTSSGKTLLAELAMAEALMRRRKVVYVAPLKALTMQKYDHLHTVFAPLGFRVVVSTRDRRGADGALRRGNFDVAVTVYEKWQNLLLTHLDLLTAVDLIVFDEPQLMLDPKRGPTVAHILDTLAIVPNAPRVLLLAARLPQADELAKYLNASVQRVHRRPVELRLGVLQNGHFHFREHNSTAEGDEPLPWNDHLTDAEQPAALLQALAERGERILVFCPSKAECHRRAQILSERCTASLELADDDQWRLQSGPSLAPALGAWLSSKIGVHHADLTPHQRALVESLFTAGHITVVFCTGTLAWGVNLPATTVFIDAQKYTSGPHAGRLVPIPLNRLEFEGMAGRAGRLGLGLETHPPKSPAQDPVARGILWGRTPCEADLLWQAYIAPDTDSNNTPAPNAPPAFAPVQRLLNWVVAGLAHSPDEARGLAERSPFGARGLKPLVREIAGYRQECGQGRTQGSPLPARGNDVMAGTGLKTRGTNECDAQNGDVWDEAAARLIAAEMIQVDGDGCLVPTPRGSKTASSGLSVTSSAAIARALDACADFDIAIWTAFLSALPEAADARLWQASQNKNAITTAWQTRFGEGFPESVARRFAGDPQSVTVHLPNAAAETRAMLMALVLDDWAAGTPTRTLEQRYGLPIGRLEPVADTIAWLFETAGALAETVISARRFAAECKRAAFEIGYGVRTDAAAMVEALRGLVPRQTLLDLIARGWDDPAILCRRRRADLVGLAPPGIIEEILRRCKAHIQQNVRDKGGSALLTINGTDTPFSGAAPPSRPSANNATTTQRTSFGSAQDKPLTINSQNSAHTKEETMSPILHLNGAPCRARLAIELAGHPLTLRLKSFKYLLALATARFLTRDGWIAKTDIEAGENQIKYLYQLRRELMQGSTANGHGTDNLIENDGNGHYRLTLPSQAIRFDLSRLLEHPDWEIRSRAERLTELTAAAGAAA